MESRGICGFSFGNYTMNLVAFNVGWLRQTDIQQQKLCLTFGAGHFKTFASIACTQDDSRLHEITAFFASEGSITQAALIQSHQGRSYCWTYPTPTNHDMVKIRGVRRAMQIFVV